MAFFVSNPLLSGLVPEHETLIYKLIWIAATSCTMLIAGLRDRADRRHAPLRLDPAVLHLMSARAPKVLRQASLPHGAPLDPQPLGRLVDGSYRSWLSTATKATSHASDEAAHPGGEGPAAQQHSIRAPGGRCRVGGGRRCRKP